MAPRRATLAEAARGRWRAVAAVLALLCGGGAGMAQGCAADPEGCAVAEGRYHIVLPDHAATDDAAIPALMFLHGWGGSGQGILRMGGMVDAALSRGYAVIAPDGVPRGTRPGLTWGFHPDRPGPRDEIAFLRAVRDDAAARHGIDPARVILGGFSIGGSMASYVACAAPDSFAAYAPVGGAFWVPVPARCAGPVDLFHTHGWSDTVVPLEGRILRGDGSGGVFAQGDVWQALQVWRAANGCRPDPDPDGFAPTGQFMRRDWATCDSGRRIGFALFDGGHAVPPGWAAMMLDWVEAR